jgi:hypothetical protein
LFILVGKLKEIEEENGKAQNKSQKGERWVWAYHIPVSYSMSQLDVHSINSIDNRINTYTQCWIKDKMHTISSVRSGLIDHVFLLEATTNKKKEQIDFSRARLIQTNFSRWWCSLFVLLRHTQLVLQPPWFPQPFDCAYLVGVYNESQHTLSLKTNIQNTTHGDQKKQQHNIEKWQMEINSVSEWHE